MIYFANPCSAAVVSAMKDGRLGFISTPAQGNIRPPDVKWIADNGCFGRGYPGDERFLEWLFRQDPSNCAFAVAPDVVGDARATAIRADAFLGPIRSFGYPVAYVAQNGLAESAAPWNRFDALFIGGTTEWKLGAEASRLVESARDRGKWVHMGRVNSWARLQYARDIGCDSVDGTFLTFGPDKNLRRLLSWLSCLERQTGLFAI